MKPVYGLLPDHMTPERDAYGYPAIEEREPEHAMPPDVVLNRFGEDEDEEVFCDV